MVDWAYVNGMSEDEDTFSGTFDEERDPEGHCGCGPSERSSKWAGNYREVRETRYELMRKQRERSRQEANERKEKKRAEKVARDKAEAYSKRTHAEECASGERMFITLGETITFGKWKGNTPEYVIKTEGYEYFVWLVKNTAVPIDTRLLTAMADMISESQLSSYHSRRVGISKLMGEAFFAGRSTIVDEASGKELKASLQTYLEGLKSRTGF